MAYMPHPLPQISLTAHKLLQNAKFQGEPEHHIVLHADKVEHDHSQ